MPNRIIREGINDSLRINALSEGAELFYRRLQLVVDDYGRYEANPELLRSKVYGLRPDRTAQHVIEFMAELTACGDPLVLTYKVGRKEYLEVQGFCQRIRQDKGVARRSKYPDPNEELAPEKQRDLWDEESLADSGRQRPPTGASCARTPPTTHTPPSSSSQGVCQGDFEQQTSALGDPAAPPQPDPDPPLWRGLLFAADQAHMIFADGELDSIRRRWGELDQAERQAALSGIEIRLQTGEYADAHYVPGLRRYVFDKRWTAKLRPGPQPKLVRSIGDERRERARMEFAERMMRDGRGCDGRAKIQSA